MVVLECIYGTQTLFNPYQGMGEGDVCTSYTRNASFFFDRMNMIKQDDFGIPVVFPRESCKSGNLILLISNL